MRVLLIRSSWLVSVGLLFAAAGTTSCSLLVGYSLKDGDAGSITDAPVQGPCAPNCTLCDLVTHICYDDAGAAGADAGPDANDAGGTDATVPDAATADAGADALANDAGGRDAVSPVDANPGSDASDAGTDSAVPFDAAPPCNGNGCTCATGSDCQSGTCATATDLPGDIFDASGPICVSSCCTSWDCPPNDVCVGTGYGGNYCMQADASYVGRTLKGPDASAGGAPCNVDQAPCRSGICSDGFCVDTCCNSDSCGGDSGTATCTYAPFPGEVPTDKHGTFSCMDNHTFTAYPCDAAGSLCESGLCIFSLAEAITTGSPRECTPACRSDSDCDRAQGESCLEATVDVQVPARVDPRPIVRVCGIVATGSKGSPPGSAASSNACSSALDCSSLSCTALSSGGNFCAVECFTSDDCVDAGLTPYTCKPVETTSSWPGFLPTTYPTVCAP